MDNMKPMQWQLNGVNKRYLFFLKNYHEVQHIQVKTDDTDILFLLLYYFWSYKPVVQITMKKFNGNVIDINRSASMLGSICSQLLAMHALTGSDSTSYPCKKGKSIGLNVLNKYSEIRLEIFRDPTKIY